MMSALGAMGAVLLFAGVQFDSTVPATLQAQVTGDLQFIQSVQSTKESPLHQEIFGKADGANYMKWFTDRVQFFGLDSCGGAVACHMQGPRIYVTETYVTSNYPQIARLMTVFHEARHTEDANGNWEHAKCPAHYNYRSIWSGTRLARKAACDTTVQGSYGSATVLLNNISKFCSNCSDKVKEDAKVYSEDQANRLITAESQAQMKADFDFQ